MKQIKKKFWEGESPTLKKQVKMFVFISWKKQVKMLVFISWLVSFGVCIRIQYFFDVVRNKLQTKSLLELIKRRSKAQEKNMSCERGLNFFQWKTFSENYKPVRVWLWLVYKFAENYCRLRLFLACVHSNSEDVSYLSCQNTYLNLKTTCHTKLKLLLWTKLIENFLLANLISHICHCSFKGRGFYFRLP